MSDSSVTMIEATSDSDDPTMRQLIATTNAIEDDILLSIDRHCPASITLQSMLAIAACALGQITGRLAVAMLRNGKDPGPAIETITKTLKANAECVLRTTKS